MAADINVVVVTGAIVRNEVRTFNSGNKLTVITLAGEETIIGQDGRERIIPFYQPVEVRGKEGEEAAKLPVGTPCIAEGQLYQSEWEDPQTGEKKRRTTVRGRTLRAIHGTDEDAFGADQAGNARLKGGFAHFWGTVNVTRDPDWRPVGQGGMVGNIGAASGESWMVVEDGVGVWKERTNWVRLTAWHEQAFRLQEVGLSKGSSLFVHARIENGNYDDKTTGKKVYTTDLNLLSATPRGRRGEEWSMTFPAKGAGGGGQSLSEADLADLFSQELPEEAELPF